MLTRTLLLGATTLVALSAPAAQATSAAQIDAASIDAVVQDHRDDTGLPGAAVAITRGKQVVHAAGYGHTPAGDPITEHTPMAVASVSKSFTGLAVMQLVEAGKINLDQPVRAYLPEFTMADARAAEITVRHLLNQTSGMSDTTFPPYSRRQPHSLREAVAGMRAARLATAPGTRFEYHNPNYQVAARLVEEISGRAFGDYLRQHVFSPLGMADSRTIDTARDLPPSACGHLMILGAAVPVPEPPAFGNGSGGVLSSAHDMAAWLIAQNNHGRGPASTAIAAASTITATHTPSAASGSYAFGWTVGTTPSRAPVIAHGGDLFTSTAYQALLPDSGHGIAVLANTGLAFGDATAIAERLIALLERTPVPAARPPFVLIDATLLALAAVTVPPAVRGVRRARHWATRRKSRPRAMTRLLPLAVCPALCATLHQVVGLLYRGRDVAWIHLPYLYPTFTLALGIATLGCTAVLGRRLAAIATRPTRRRNTSSPSPESRQP